jgi:hypothetical protein
VAVAVGLGVDVGVSVAVAVAVGVGVSVAVGVAVGVSVAVAVAVGVGVGVASSAKLTQLMLPMAAVVGPSIESFSTCTPEGRVAVDGEVVEIVCQLGADQPPVLGM